MYQLSPELWARIASFTAHQDLSRLALVSSLHRDVARREQDKELVLETSMRNNRKAADMVDFLVRSDRARNVRFLTLHDEDTISLHLAKTLRSFPNLRVLSMLDVVTSVQQQGQLIEVLRSHCTHLEDFILSAWDHEPGHDFALPNLKRVGWNESGRISPSFLSLCRASLTTLRDIELSTSDGTRRVSSYVEFLSLRFPALQALKFGPGPPNLFAASHKGVVTILARAFTDFLVAHPGIAYLRLLHGGYHDLSNGDSYIPLDLKRSSEESANILPNLITLRAHPNQVSAFAEVGSLFFKKTLRALYITSAVEWRELDVEIHSMLKSLVKYATDHGPSHTVQELAFTDVLKDEVTLNADLTPHIQQAAAIFPSLRLWKGRIPRNTSGNSLARVFSQLSCLRTLAIQTVTDKQIREPDIAVIAAKCLSLEQVVCARANYGNIYDIARGPSGRVEVKARDMDPEDDRYHSEDENVNSELEDSDDE